MINTNGELNNYLVIDGLKNNDFNQAFNKNLLIRNFTPDDNWDFLLKFKNIENLRVEDSYINSENFLKILLQFKNIKHLIYNHYCYFTKIKNKQALNKLSLRSLTKFTIEFPKEEEPDLDINYYSAISYKNKHNSITDINGYENIFTNLEEIEFLNYNTYLERVLKNDDKEDINKLKKEIYWNVSFKKLSLLKNLKNIKIDDGKYENLIELGLDKFFNKSESISLNGYKNFSEEYLKKIKTLQFFYNRYDKKHNIFSKIKPDLLNQYQNIINDKFCLNINEYEYYTKPNGYQKKFKVKKNNNYEKILSNEFETIIFSCCKDFLSENTRGTWDFCQKGYIFEKILKQQKHLKNIIFEFKISDSYSSWTSGDITKLNKYLYSFAKNFPNLNFYFFHEETEKILDNKKSVDKFNLFFLLLYDLFQNSPYKSRIHFFSKNKIDLEEYFNKHINENINQVIIIDDIIYNNTNYFPKKFLIHPSDISSLSEYFPEVDLNYDAGNITTITGSIFYEILRIASFTDYNFEPDKNQLILVISKNELKNFKNLNFKKVFYYIGSPGHIISYHMDCNEKKYNFKKNIGIAKNNTLEGIEKVYPKIHEAAKKTANEIVDSKYFTSSNITAEDLLQNVEKYEIISDLDLNFNAFKDLELFWLEGVRPWQQRYVKLDKINQLVPANKLKKLRLSDCTYFKNTSLSELKNLEVLSISPHQNHHFKEDNDITISGFEKCENLRILRISNLASHFNKKLFHKTLGFTGYSTNLNYTDTYGYTNLDLSNVDQCKNLKKISLYDVTAKNINKLKTVTSLENLTIHIINHTPQKNDNIFMNEPEITDKDLFFLKNSKNLKNINMRMGDPALREDYYGNIHSSYSGNSEFIEFINYKIKKLTLSINFKKKNLFIIKDIINKISNRLIQLEELNLTFGITIDNEPSETLVERYLNIKVIKPIEIDFSKFSKIINLKKLSFQISGIDNFIPFKTINFKSITNFKKIKDIEYDWDSIDFKELREARLALKKENFNNPQLYDGDYDYYVKTEEDKAYEKNWSRASWINTNNWDDWYPLEERYLTAEKENNKKKFVKPRLIINKK